jgi:hypothetical protein
VIAALFPFTVVLCLLAFLVVVMTVLLSAVIIIDVVMVMHD